MARHVWLRKPTAERALELETGFRRALSEGLTPIQAASYAAYNLESLAQTSSSYGRVDVASVKKSKFRFMKGKNGPHYLECFVKHVPLMPTLFQSEAGLSNETPWQVVADALEDQGKGEWAELLRLANEKG